MKKATPGITVTHTNSEKTVTHTNSEKPLQEWVVPSLRSPISFHQRKVCHYHVTPSIEIYFICLWCYSLHCHLHKESALELTIRVKTCPALSASLELSSALMLMHSIFNGIKTRSKTYLIHIMTTSTPNSPL